MGNRNRSVVALVLALVLSTVAGAMAQPVTADPVQRQWSAVLPAYADTLEAQVESGLSHYRVTADFVPATDEALGSISGDLTLDWINPADEPAEEIHFRLYVNDSRYRDGDMTVFDVAVNGESVEPAFDVEDTVMTIPLAHPVPTGARAEVTLAWDAVIPNNTVSGYGMFNHDTATDSYTLDHWLPLLAGYDPANGFDLAPLSVNGDPVFSNVAFFEVTIGDLTGLTLASTGVVEADEETAEGLRRTIVSGPVRNFTMAISANYELATGYAGDTEIRSYFLPGHQERGEASVEWSIAAIELFNELIGPYPYAQFSVIDAEIGGGAAGIEFPQIVYMASSYYSEPLDGESFPRGQEFTLVHEIVHQWFYGLVGNNQHRHAFLDEALTNFYTTVYFERIYGEEVALQQTLLNVLAPYVIFLHGLPSGPGIDEPVNTPTDDFRSSIAYGVVVYNKGPLAFQAIREALGDDVFFPAVAAYFGRMQLLIAQPADLYDALAAVAPDDLDFAALWRHWIEEANGAEDFPQETFDQVLIALRGS